MKITTENAEQLCTLFEEIDERLGEFKDICRKSMSPSEYEQFKYRTLGQIEPAIRQESDWVTRYSSVDSLESIAIKALDLAGLCVNCGDPIGEDECNCKS